MLIKDKDILSSKTKTDVNKKEEEKKVNKDKIDSKYIKQAWGDAFDYYLRGISEKFLSFHNRATPLEFWGFMAVSGILFFPLYYLAYYIENKMIILYFYLATSIPIIAVCVRRFHDINKKAFWYFLFGFASIISYFFIKLYAFIFIGLWLIVVIRLMLKDTYLADGLFGDYFDEAKKYEGCYNKIVRKFFNLAISCFIVLACFTYVNVDLWKQHNMQKMVFEDIFNMVYKEAKQNDFNDEQIKQANSKVRDLLKTLSGQKVSKKQLNEQINLIIEQIKTPNIEK